LREVRSERGMTLKNVASITGISIPTLSRVERGDANEIESNTLLALSKWAKLPFDLFQKGSTSKRKLPAVGSDISTPDAVELHLRADKNLAPKTAELLVKMFRAAYSEAASEFDE
jgi:transcriptional regulator with XRE-family HTH domain